jgi:hypothetical protein
MSRPIMKHLWTIACASGVLSWLCVAPAWASEPEASALAGASPDGASPAGASPAGASPAGAARAGTSSAFDEALREADRRFVAGDLAGALRVLEPECAESDRPACAFSLGAIHHGLGQCPTARSFYRRYLELAPEGERAVEVREALDEVEAHCGSAASPSSPALAPGPTDAVAPGPRASVPASSPDRGLSSEGWLAAPAEPPSSSLSADLAVASLALSGAAALSSIAFGLLAAHDASQCRQAQAYDREFVERCEGSGPRYQGLWQGFALASGSFLGIGLALWAFDPGPSGATASGPSPQVGYRGRF